MTVLHEPALAGNDFGLPFSAYTAPTPDRIDAILAPGAAMIQRKTGRPAPTCRLLAQVAGFRVEC